MWETLIGLNPDQEKNKITKEYIINESDYDIYSEFETKPFNEINVSLFNYVKRPTSKSDRIKEELFNHFSSIKKEDKISYQVYESAETIVSELIPSIVENLSLENVYNTKYGTIIMEWCGKGNDIFSLEIAPNKLGYFIEKDGIDEKQIDEVQIHSHIPELLSDLSTFLP